MWYLLEQIDCNNWWICHVCMRMWEYFSCIFNLNEIWIFVKFFRKGWKVHLQIFHFKSKLRSNHAIKNQQVIDLKNRICGFSWKFVLTTFWFFMLLSGRWGRFSKWWCIKMSENREKRIFSITLVNKKIVDCLTKK